MVKEAMKRRNYMQSKAFKEAMQELCKNRKLSIQMAEEQIGLEKDFTVQVEHGIIELSLENVIKIAEFFGTTIDSVLDGGHQEIRISCDKTDKLAFQYFKKCIETYSKLLCDKGCNYWKPGLWSKQVDACEVDLEKQEHLYMERYKTYMDEYDRKKIQPMDAAGCCDEVLIEELIKRGFKVERTGNNGKKTNKSSK